MDIARPSPGGDIRLVIIGCPLAVIHYPWLGIVRGPGDSVYLDFLIVKDAERIPAEIAEKSQHLKLITDKQPEFCLHSA